MKVKMLASMRAFTLMGLELLQKQTKAAERESRKAMLNANHAVEQLGRIDVAIEQLPMSEDASAVWDVPQDIVITYRDGLVMFGSQVQKTLAREKENRNDDAAAATLLQLQDIGEQLRAMGDQRDIFAEDDEEEESADEKQMELVES